MTRPLESNASLKMPSDNGALPLINTDTVRATIDDQAHEDVLASVTGSSLTSKTNVNHAPLRYGSAASIPHDAGFDLQSILHGKTPGPRPSQQTNDLLQYLNREKSNPPLPVNRAAHELLVHSERDRMNLVQAARKAQQDFINAIRLD